MNWNAWKTADVLEVPFDGKNPGVAVPSVEKMTLAGATAAEMLKRPATKKSLVIDWFIVPCPERPARQWILLQLKLEDGSMQIEDRVFIVTGASSGIGLSTAVALSERGAKVALLARSTDALEELARKLHCSLPVTADMTQFHRVREAIGEVHRHYGRIDGLINNAGRSYAASVEEIDPALFDEIFHLNVLGPIVAMQAVIPLMRAQGGGSIVNINSGTAFMTVRQYSVYSSSKRALLGFSLTAHIELKTNHI